MAFSRSSRLERLNRQRPLVPRYERAAVFLSRPVVLSTALLWQEVLKAAHLDRTAVAVMQRDRLLPAPLDRRNHSLFRVRLFVLSPSRHRIAADEHRNRRRPDADGKPPCVAPIVLGLLQDK